jgi:hypothetical protein
VGLFDAYGALGVQAQPQGSYICTETYPSKVPRTFTRPTASGTASVQQNGYIERVTVTFRWINMDTFNSIIEAVMPGIWAAGWSMEGEPAKTPEFEPNPWMFRIQMEFVRFSQN